MDQLLHGEPHPGNVLGTKSGPLFIDFETCCWDRGDQFPNGRRFGEELLHLLREGPPWPTLDAVTSRLDGL